VVTRLAILGATGSIGVQALDVVRSNRDRLRVTALASARNASALEALATETGAVTTVLQERDGDDALCDLATRDDVDLVLVATPGIAGLAPTLAALRAGKRVALANKEVLVTGGHLVAPLAGGAGERLRPVDSEHCALWQCLIGERIENVSRVAVTASGGPFRERELGELATVTPDEALRHPTWKMAPRSRSTRPPSRTRGTRSSRRTGSTASRTTASTSSSIPRASSTRWSNSPTAA